MFIGIKKTRWRNEDDRIKLFNSTLPIYFRSSLIVNGKDSFCILSCLKEFRNLSYEKNRWRRIILSLSIR